MIEQSSIKERGNAHLRREKEAMSLVRCIFSKIIHRTAQRGLEERIFEILSELLLWFGIPANYG